MEASGAAGVEACLARWRRADDESMADAARYKLAVPWDDDTTVRPGMVRLWRPGGQRVRAGSTVPLEFFFPEAPEEIDERRFAQAFASTLHVWLREQRCAEFRARLTERQSGTLRRRNNSHGSLEQLEAGDQTEENWRDFLQRPLLEDEPPKAVALILNPRFRAFRVLVCRVALPPASAEHVGRLAFRHIFDDDPRSSADRSWGGGLMTCLYVLVAMFVVVLVLTFGVLIRGFLKQ